MIDCVDFGCGRGRTLPVGGVGVDIQRSRARKAGGRVVVADATKPVFKPKSFRRATMMHMLEHLPNLEAVESVIREASVVATDSLLIMGPWFDADEYLAGLGFNLYWSSWPGHPTHLTTVDLILILDRLGFDFAISGTGDLITDSSSRIVHPIGYEAGGRYVDGQYPPKELVEFTVPIYHELSCEVTLR